ncbi:hypothetical protein AVEN_147638-1 [Araneus ventricosus]|uniref:Uncharacterized protein n=1 Tax=Araneus ventricosus TaxID=182803 RepID=A0A4Y2HEI2_ARAVE|nr:hypothetical protein AVEN_147638-1 [Araneus ventricosus]
MSVFLGRLKQAKDRLEAVGKKIDNDEYAYQMLMNLPPEYGNVAQQLYLLDDNGFTPEDIKKKLISEYDRLKYEDLNEAGPSYNETDSNLMLARKKKVPNKFPGWLRTKEDSNTEANLKGSASNVGRLVLFLLNAGKMTKEERRSKLRNLVQVSVLLLKYQKV